MTYPYPEVVSLLNERFVAVKVNVEAPTPEAVPFLRSVRPLWAPDFLFLEATGGLLRRRVGYAPPDEFVAELQLVLGQAALLHREFDLAGQLFEAAAGTSRQRHIAPEALFWKGVAAFKATRDRAVLQRGWDEIRERFGHTIWWTRAEASYGERPSRGFSRAPD